MTTPPFLNPKKQFKESLQKQFGDEFTITSFINENEFGGTAIIRNKKLGGRKEDIKFLGSIEPHTRKQFIHEAKLLSVMNHPAIQKVYDVHIDEETILFRTEHIEGYSLEEILQAIKQKKETIPKEVTREIIYTLAKALRYAHKGVLFEGSYRSIIHCDIKPSNIILSAEGLKRKKEIDSEFLEAFSKGKCKPHIIDFGIAQFKGKVSGISGTKRYLSPMQVKNEFIDWRTDMHQLMLVCHEMLTLKKPYSTIKKKTEIIQKKETENFQVEKSKNISKDSRIFLQKALAQNPEQFFKTEEKFMKELHHLYKKIKREEWLRKYGKIAAIAMIGIILVIASIVGYHIWDYQTNSIDAIVKQIQNNPNPTITELESAVQKIQKRAFEKKYLKPLLEGEFRDEEGNASYPVYLNADGEWVLAEGNDENAGAFVNMLYQFVKEYPEIEPYLQEYTDPVYNSEIDWQHMNRYALGLIPAYEYTKDDKYLNKLKEVADAISYIHEVKKGFGHTRDLYDLEVLFWLSENTQNESYLNKAESAIKNFITLNIEDNGYVYEMVTKNASTIYGPIPDSKMNRNTIQTKSFNIGGFLDLANNASKKEIESFQEKTSCWTRDYINTIKIIRKINEINPNRIYLKTLDTLENFYEANDQIDRLFLKNNNNTPTDTLATLNYLKIMSSEKRGTYKEKLNKIITNHINKESEKGILNGNSLIIDTKIDISQKNNKNQSLFMTDKIFLELNS